jgi:RNA polymerase sigma-70 factor (ECF subfamily)
MTQRDDSDLPPTKSEHTALMRELAGYWVQSQSVIAAFITANVFDSHHAEDIVQEVAQVVAEKFASFDRSQSFVGWALGIARNRIMKYYRTRARDRVVLSEGALVRLGEALESIGPDNEDRRDALRQFLQPVAGRRREVLVIRYRDNAKVTDIAGKVGMSTSAVSVMLHRIRVKLYECIERNLQKLGHDHGKQ